ncbi:alpha-L-rhamnosidase [Cohnella fermenti]|uniref:alpha-L-rhamnosidase n=2 Tax=Cohnella fermenti TaxID=2565925 RepID=A0A4S4C9I4_9BACL|nr:alpha-L-rhamnosidase [Cohnella fermenti]
MDKRPIEEGGRCGDCADDSEPRHGEWHGQWIADPRLIRLEPLPVYHREHDKRSLSGHEPTLANQHMLVRKRVRLEKTCREAWMRITADDYYKLYINGSLAGQGPAQSYSHHYYYNQYEISSYLQPGDNVIAVHLYYHGLICRSYSSGDNRQGMIAELWGDGRLLAATDESWRYSRAEEYGEAEIVGYNTQFAENVDLRKRSKGWRTPGFDDSAWPTATVHPQHGHSLVNQPTPTVEVYKRYPSTVRPIEGGVFLDFGTLLTGQVRAVVTGPVGASVEIRYGEELDEQGRVRWKMRCSCVYRDTWILSGEEEELEAYDYKSFRYAEIVAGPQSPQVSLPVSSIAAVVRHYPYPEEACRFESSSSRLNAIWAICANGIRYGTQENYVDCPSREKGQYLGDNTVITHAHAYLSGDLRMYRKALQEFSLLAEEVCPGLMAVAPGHHMQEIADFSLQWPMQLLRYYRMSGDLAFLRSMAPIAEGVIGYFAQYLGEDGLLYSVNGKWNLVDWPDNLRDGYDFNLANGHADGCHNVINSFYYGALEAVKEIRQALGLPADLQELAEFRNSFRERFYREDRRLFADAAESEHCSLHANALPLLFGLAPEKARDSIVALIRRKRLSCGVYMAYFVLKALAAAGEYDLLYELIVSEDLHSWNTMLEEGATACFETWSKELKWNTSLCHPWASSPIPLFIEEIAGLSPLAPGWTFIAFDPHIPDSLEWFRLAIPTPEGEIRLECRAGEVKLVVPDHCAVIRTTQDAGRGSAME